MRTRRDGVAQSVGHDLTFALDGWEGRAEVGEDGAVTAVHVEADPPTLRLTEALHGVKPLTDRDRREIDRIIQERVLRGRAIVFESRDVRTTGEGRLLAAGELTLAGAARPVALELSVGPYGRLSATTAIVQSDWGIQPYRAFMGALRVRDRVEVAIDIGLPVGEPGP